MARKKKTPTIRITVKLTLADEQALKSAAATLERDPDWVLGKLCHLAVGQIDLSKEVRRWLRGDTAWDAGLPGDQQALLTIGNPDPPVKTVERRKTVAQAPPTLEEVRAYVAAQGYGFSADEFHAFYTANGWVQGRQGKPLVDWRAAAKNWDISWRGRAASAAAPAVPDWGAGRPSDEPVERMPDDDEEGGQPSIMFDEPGEEAGAVDEDGEEAGA